MKKALTLILILFQCTRIFGQWNPESPTVVCNASGWQENATLIGDGAGGYIVAWMDQRGSLNDPEFADIYVQRIASNAISSVNYEAQNSISLNPGFEAKKGV